MHEPCDVENQTTDFIDYADFFIIRRTLYYKIRIYREWNRCTTKECQVHISPQTIRLISNLRPWWARKLKFLKGVSIMAKTPANHNKPWTQSQIKQVRQLANQNTPTRVIGLKVGRTESAIYNIAGQKDISLKPVNQSPYNKQK
jgi:hypothetical protein